MDSENRQPQIWYSVVTVEPVMFLYMMAYMITSVVEQAFFVHRACMVNHNGSQEICDHLADPNNTQISNAVQSTVSTFHQWNGIAGHIVPIILAFFLGAWSDKRGRKIVLLFGLSGKFIYSAMVILISAMGTWPLEYVIYFATIPSALTGADVAIFAACFAYISDVTTAANRTLRVGILDVCYLSAMPSGVALGAYLFSSVVNGSFTIMFAINLSLLGLAIIYTLVNLQWHTTEKHQSMRDAGVSNFFKDFFDKNHAISSIQILTKTRQSHRRTYLIIMMFSMAFYSFQRDEKPMLYLYTIKKFGWDAVIFSKFKTFSSSAFVVVMLIGIPLMSSLLKWKDTTIMMLGALSHASGRIVYALAEVSWLFYVGAAATSIGPCVAPVIRSMTSKTVRIEERGKVFALLSVCDNAVALFSTTLYSQIYNATLNTNHYNSIFYLTISTQGAVFLLALTVHIMLGSEPMEKYSYEKIIETSTPVENPPAQEPTHSK